MEGYETTNFVYGALHTLGYFYEQVHDLLYIIRKNIMLIFGKQQTVSTTEKFNMSILTKLTSDC